jgi:formylglycine-generating enzyme required for sulfatase activity
MSSDLPEGAALLVAGHGVDDRPVHTLGSIGEALLATPARWRIKRMSPGAGERFGPNRAALKRMLDGLAGATTGVALFACAGAIAGGAEPALVTGPNPAAYPEEDTLPLRWIADRLRGIEAERLVVVIAGKGDGPVEGWLRAMRTDGARDVIAVDGGAKPAALEALLYGLCGSALDPTTGTITLRSLSEHLAKTVPGIAIQRSTAPETIASPPPLGLLWDARASVRTTSVTQRQGARDEGAPDDLVGVVLPGRFRVDAELARGSFGAVYRARQLTVDRDVAVKVVHAGVDPTSDDGKLFVQEIQAVGRIDHRNVVRIFQADVTPDGRLFFAMELLGGRDLRTIGDAARVPLDRAVALTRQLLAGLGAAHDAGLVHADVKPANALVVDGKDGERVVLVDFGLARLKPKDEGEAVESLGGTPAFMAPEQLRGERIDTRADLFSAALVLVFLVTGWRRKKADELVPPLDDIADPVVREALAMALAVEPAARFQTAADFAEALVGKKSRTEPTAITRAPFHHLASFTERDHGRLHGRERDLALLVEHALYRRAAIYTAPSGTGKTSLLRAGLVPKLGTLGARAIYFSCRAGGEAGLATAIAPGSTTIADAIRAHANGRLVLVLDQVETALETADGAALIDAALAFDRWPADADVAVILSVREDFLARLIGHRTRIDEGVPIVRLGPLSPDGAREAIGLPLAEARLTIAPELLDVLLADLQRAAAAVGAELGWGGTPAVYPPHLQLAGAALYDALGRGETTLTLDHYRRLGGLDAIVGEHLDRVLDRELDDASARVARDVFLALVTATQTRAVRPESELLESVGRDKQTVLLVLEALRSRGLMVRVRAPGGEPAWELVHDSLVPRILAWIDNRDLARRRAIELVRYHIRRSRVGAPSLLGRAELREVTDHAAAIDDLDREYASRPGEPWTPLRLVDESRRARRRRLTLGATAVTVMLGIAGVAIASWAVQRAHAAHEQALRDRDIGVFTLDLAPFDWDPETLTASEVPAGELPALRWRVLEPDADDPDRPGDPRADNAVVRSAPTIDASGHLVQRVETRSGHAYLAIDGRGRGGEACPPSIIPLRQLPGYAQRVHDDVRLKVRVPTCRASSADTIAIPAGPAIHGGVGEPPSKYVIDFDPNPSETTVDLPAFRIDRTEVTNAALAIFAVMEPVTGIAAPELMLSNELRNATGAAYPALGMTAYEADAYCRFHGKQLPSSEQWEKAMRGGLELGGEPNPMPRRNLPWGAPVTPVPARIKDTGLGPAPVGTVGDVSPYGVVDMAGNAQEWTSSSPPGTGRRIRVARGGNWGETEAATLVDFMAIDNHRASDQRSYSTGARCVTDM